MKNGMTKRGSTYSYVVRIPDPKTGKTKPHWVRVFKTEKEAKSAPKSQNPNPLRKENKMNKTFSKNLPIYVLSGAIALAGIASANSAQGAPSAASQIASLQKQVKALQTRLDNPESVTIKYAAIGAGFSKPCGDGTQLWGGEVAINISSALITCTLDISVPK